MRCALVVVLASGCVSAPGEIAAPERGSVAAFVELAQPVLAERCANPSCHGDASRPLSLFAVRRHRLDPRDVYLETPLSDEEVAHNFAQTAAFLEGVSRASDSLLLRKPLARDGVAHRGGAVFPDDGDYGYQRLRAWIDVALAAEAGR